MHQYKFQIPKRSKELRGQVFSYLYENCDTITIESQDEIEPDRFLAFSHPFDNWVFDAIKNPNINFFHIDNGYLGNMRHKTPFYYRISYNSLQNTKVKDVSSSRINMLKLDDNVWNEDWNTKGDYNLLVMPNNSNIFKYLGQDYNTWRTDTIRHYDSLPERLIIREKEGKRRQRFQEVLPLMANAKKVITYHSMAVVEALCLGKPIKVLGQSAVQHWEDQKNFDRTPMLEHIAWSQFNRDEFSDGTAWHCTFEYQVDNVYV